MPTKMANAVKLALYANMQFILQILKDLKVVSRWVGGMGATHISGQKFFIFLLFGGFSDKRLDKS